MPEEQPSVIKRLDNRQKGIKEFINTLNFEIANAYVENIKAIEGGINSLTSDQKTEIAGKIYEAERGLYLRFLGMKAEDDNFWGQTELSYIFEKNSGVDKGSFVEVLKEKMTLEGLLHVNNEIFQNLGKHELSKISHDLKEDELPAFKNELIRESKDKYNKDFSPEKITKLDDALKIYSVLRASPSPENFSTHLKKYLA